MARCCLFLISTVYLLQGILSENLLLRGNELYNMRREQDLRAMCSSSTSSSRSKFLSFCLGYLLTFTCSPSQRKGTYVHDLTHSFHCSLTRLRPQPCAHPLSHSLTHSVTHSCTRPLTHSGISQSCRFGHMRSVALRGLKDQACIAGK